MKLRRNIIANYVGQALSVGLSLAFVPVYIRCLTIEAYALVGLFAVMQVWMSLLDLGMTPTISREMARFTAGSVSVQFIRNLLRSIELICLVIGIAVTIGMVLVSGFLATHWLKVENLPLDTVAHALAITGGVLALRFCEGVYRSAIVGLQQQVWLNVATVALSVLRSVGAVLVLAFVAPTIDAFFVWQALVSMLTLVVFARKLGTALPAAPEPPRFSRHAIAEVRHFAGGMIGIALLGVLLTQLDKLLLSRLLPLAEFGYYMLASTVTGGLYLAVSPIIVAYYPALVHWLALGDRPAVSAAYHKASQMVTVLLAPAVLVLAVHPRGVLFAWSGDPVLMVRAAPLLALLAVGTFCNALMQIPHQLQLAAGWTSLALRMNMVAVAVMVPAILYFVPRYGGVAAGSIWLVLNAIYLLVGMPLLHRRMLIGELWSWTWGDVLLPLLGSALVLVLSWPLAPAHDESRIGWLVYLIVTGSLAAAASALCASLVRPQLRALAGQLLRR